ncbi:MAG: L,D-transpeptidase [Solirubrobacteraceae bacterium]
MGCGDEPTQARAPAATATPKPFEPSPEPTPAKVDKPRHATAAITRTVGLRDRPRGETLQRIGPETEFGSGMVFGVLGRRDGWLKVAASQLPNGERGWIPARTATVLGTDMDIHVDRSKLQATLRDDGRAVLRFPVAVGRPGNETPLGRYAVTDKLTPTDGTSPYGCCALALTGHQTRLEPGWPGGDRLAIHGTPAVETIGTAASLGCMRAPEDALRRLMRQVPLGAPVVVKA